MEDTLDLYNKPMFVNEWLCTKDLAKNIFLAEQNVLILVNLVAVVIHYLTFITSLVLVTIMNMMRLQILMRLLIYFSVIYKQQIDQKKIRLDFCIITNF